MIIQVALTICIKNCQNRPKLAIEMYLQIQMYLTSKKKWIERIGGKSSFNGEFRIYIPVVKHLQIFIVSNVEYTKKLASLFKWKLYKCKMVNCKMHKIFRFTLLKQSAVLCWRTENYELQALNIFNKINREKATLRVQYLNLLI